MGAERKSLRLNGGMRGGGGRFENILEVKSTELGDEVRERGALLGQLSNI